MSTPKKIHIMGIGGSAASGIAQIAQSYGFEVTGCDNESSTPYLEKTKNSGIKTYVGHDISHISDVDLVVVSPALLYQNLNHPEVITANNSNRLMTWEEFLGTYLHQDKYVICIAGTHGKSTTTALTGLLLEKANLDPTVVIGATLPAWNNNIRIGNSKYFVTEADEFNDNYLHYHPNVIILNNIEMDHPEYFKTKERLLESFNKFVHNIKFHGLLIYNQDSPWAQEVIANLQPGWVTSNQIQILPYSLSDYQGSKFPLSIPGNHNKSNAQGVVLLAKFLNIPQETTAKSLKSFTGLNRRIQLLGEKNGVKVYDDYANHPTAFAASISGIRELNPNSRIWAIIEPHTFSRLRTVLNQLPESVKDAYRVIITKIFPSREKDPGDFSGQTIVDYLDQHLIDNKPAHYQPNFDTIVKIMKQETKPGDVILVMGSGDSYKLSRQLLEFL